MIAGNLPSLMAREEASPQMRRDSKKETVFASSEIEFAVVVLSLGYGVLDWAMEELTRRDPNPPPRTE